MPEVDAPARNGAAVRTPRKRSHRGRLLDVLRHLCSQQPAVNEARRITVWICDECGYWRQDRTTGAHQASDPDNPTGKLLVHELRAAEFVEADAGDHPSR